MIRSGHHHVVTAGHALDSLEVIAQAEQVAETRAVSRFGDEAVRASRQVLAADRNSRKRRLHVVNEGRIFSQPSNITDAESLRRRSRGAGGGSPLRAQ